jgi:hypothetical protein
MILYKSSLQNPCRQNDFLKHRTDGGDALGIYTYCITYTSDISMGLRIEVVLHL